MGKCIYNYKLRRFIGHEYLIIQSELIWLHVFLYMCVFVYECECMSHTLYVCVLVCMCEEQGMVIY